MACSDSTTTLYKHFIARHDVKGGHVALQALWNKRHSGEILIVQLERRGLVEHLENFFRLVTQCTQKNGSRQLTAAVDSREHLVFGVEFKVEP